MSYQEVRKAKSEALLDAMSKVKELVANNSGVFTSDDIAKFIGNRDIALSAITRLTVKGEIKREKALKPGIACIVYVYVVPKWKK